MPQFTHVIFDLDGTLTDSRQGIRNSLRFAMAKMDLGTYSEELLSKFIGPPLQQCFKANFGLNDPQTALAVQCFREYYGDKGWAENEPYPGISELLQELHQNGVAVFVATSKLEKYARMIIEQFGFDKYITDLKGADYGGNHTKTGLITELMEMYRIPASGKTAMVGDTHFDILGARECGISSVAVGYGFGNTNELRDLNPDFYADDVDELFEILN